MTEENRRQFLLACATGAAVALAGCGEASRDEDGESVNPLTDDDGVGEDESTADELSGPEGEVDSYLRSVDAGGYDGEIVDSTGESSVTVTVGAGNGLAFDPPAVQIDSGTTIVWEWTGEGGGHNVVPSDDSEISGFGEEEIISEAGHTAEHTFEEDGIGLYYCNPHRASGMHGAIIVGSEGAEEAEDASGNQTDGGQATGNQTGQTSENQTEGSQASGN